MKNHKKIIASILKEMGKPAPLSITPLPPSGSARLYFRCTYNNGETLIASYNPDVKENTAFYTFSHHFKKIGLPVPALLARNSTFEYFILEDAGEKTLLDIRLQEGLSERVKQLYIKAIEDLVKFQVEGIKGLDLTVSFPTDRFDKRSIMWDLNYFKYYFIKTNNIIFDENLLENEFNALAEQLLEADSAFFMYRDFQARNIMVKGNNLSYIDFQGGRRGPLQYDVVSLLYQAKANLPDVFRKELLNFYFEKLQEKIPKQKNRFLKTYPLFICFRLMQVLGAYGYRGIYQRKGHFLQSIPYALKSLDKVLTNYPISEYPLLNKIFKQIVELKKYDFPAVNQNKLTVTLSSFSYKKSGIPVDITDNGGGFVFDCRALPNPGRINELKMFTGLQPPVINYFKDKKEMTDFLANVYKLVDQSVDNYLARGFSNLMVSFGCTGGRHRSVYSAENLKRHLTFIYGDKLNIQLVHLQLKEEGLL